MTEEERYIQYEKDSTLYIYTAALRRCGSFPIVCSPRKGDRRTDEPHRACVCVVPPTGKSNDDIAKRRIQHDHAVRRLGSRTFLDGGIQDKDTCAAQPARQADPSGCALQQQRALGCCCDGNKTTDRTDTGHQQRRPPAHAFNNRKCRRGTHTGTGRSVNTQ